MVAVCHRAGWSVGDVLSRYLKNNGAGDQFAGRVACGLPVLAAEFSSLPPHFRADAPHSLAHCIQIAYPFEVPASTRPVLRMGLASMVHHRSYVEAALPMHLRTHEAFLLLGDLAPHLQDPDTSTMKPTGIPPASVMVQVQLRSPPPRHICPTITLIFHVGLSRLEVRLTEMLELQRQLPETLTAAVSTAVTNAFRENDIANDTASMSAVRALITAEIHPLVNMLEQALSRTGTAATTSSDPEPTTTTTDGPAYTMYTWSRTWGPMWRRSRLLRA
jgi:hypothetical protein